MLEASLSMVAAFAAYTVYAIAGDEFRSKRATHQPTGKRTAIAAENKGRPAPGIRAAKAPAKTKPTKATAPRKTKAAKPSKATNTNTVNPDAILAYLAAQGLVSIANLAKALKADKAAVAVVAGQLIAEHSAVAIKRGGYPGIAPKG
jgi:hypothetical protein